MSESKGDDLTQRVGKAKSKKPANTPFKQQRLKAWQPILTPKWVILVYSLIGVIFLPLGAILLTTSNEVVEARCQYDGTGTGTASAPAANPSICPVVPEACRVTKMWNATSMYWEKNLTERQATTCDIELTMPATPAGKTVYVYVELTNFYQNHRRYVKSRQDTQLRGEDSGKVMPATKLDTACAPMAKDGNGTYYWPCGLIAQSFFNDEIKIPAKAGVLDEAGIAWNSDRTTKFGNPDFILATNGGGMQYIKQKGLESKYPNLDNTDVSYAGIQEICGYSNATAFSSGNTAEYMNLRDCWRAFWKPSHMTAALKKSSSWGSTSKAYTSRFIWEDYPQLYDQGLKNEHFIVWMRTAGLPTFRKLYGKIVPGDNGAGPTSVFEKDQVVTMTVDSRFMVSSFEGTKSIVFATTSWLGGKNLFLAYAYLIVGAVCLLLAAIFGVKHVVSPRTMGDPSLLKWKKERTQ